MRLLSNKVPTQHALLSLAHLISRQRPRDCIRERGACTGTHKQLFSDAQGFNDLSQCVQLGPQLSDFGRHRTCDIMKIRARWVEFGCKSHLLVGQMNFRSVAMVRSPFIAETPSRIRGRCTSAYLCIQRRIGYIVMYTNHYFIAIHG
jgi:hypothetical protein